MSKITVIKVQKGSMLDTLLSGNVAMWVGSYMGYVWLVVALAFLFAELNTPGIFFFVSFAVGSICASVLAFMGYSFFLQCVLGLAVSLISFFMMRKFLKRTKMSEVEYGTAITNIDALVGRQGLVLGDIEPHGKGQVKVGGEVWRASAEGDATLAKGEIVSVLRVEGNTIIVELVKRGENL